jgi:hypothetical protein
MDHLQKRKETRRQNALDRLGSNNPCCCMCGIDDPTCLERHHLAGRKNDEFTVIVCRNHHRMLTNDQKDHAVLLAGTPPELTVLLNLLLGLADFFQLLVQKLREIVASHKLEATRVMGAK